MSETREPIPGAGDTRAERIEAAGFEPLAQAGPRRAGGPRISPLRALLGFALLVFVLLMLFLFSARSVEIVVRPADGQFAEDLLPEVGIGGLAIPFGQRFLLRPGSYPLSVQAEGYVPLSTTLEVSAEDSQRREIRLEPLPGVLRITGAPENASLYVDDAFVAQAPLDAVEIAAGERQLRIEAPRYFPAERMFTVAGRGRTQALDVALQPAWAEVSLQSTPAGAGILLDGDETGATPATLEVLEGEHRLLLRAPGYSDLERTLTVTAGEPQDLGNLVLEPAAGLLSLATEPSGANVTVDGEFRGQTPITLELEPGRGHELMLSRPGYSRYRETVQLGAAETLERRVTLEAQLGEVVFDIAPAEAELRINGRAVGRGPQTLELPATEQRIEVVLEGYATQRRRVTPRPGLAQRVQVALLTEQAALMASIKPEITTAVGQTLKLFIPGDAPRSEFSMGASRREAGRRANEVMHPVRLERMFYLQTTEVTNAQFRQYLGEHQSGQVQGSSLNREQQPVVQVSWQQAASFCNWLSRREGLPPFYREQQGIIIGFDPESTGYRLPTEAEWAWASRVRGEDTLTFSWGEEFPPPDNTENLADAGSAYVTGRVLSNYRDGHVVSAPVASFKPNHNGLYDMGGNVSEWMHDVYKIPASSAVLAVDPLGEQRGDNYAIRGASWALGRRSELRLSYRDYHASGRDDLGFRIARYAQ